MIGAIYPRQDWKKLGGISEETFDVCTMMPGTYLTSVGSNEYRQLQPNFKAPVKLTYAYYNFS